MRNSSHYVINKRTELIKLTAFVAANAPYQLPVWRAARDGLINLIQPQRGAQIPQKMLERTGRPIIILIGDDDDVSTGPAAWACALRVRRWALTGMIHAAAGEPQHYENVLMGALLTRRFLLIETSMVHHAAWKEFLNVKIATQSVISRTGVHPTVTPREAMN